MYLLLRWFALALGLAVTGCQLLADIQTHDPDPLPKTCELPTYVAGTAGAGRARLAHVLPTVDKIDVCVRSSGGPSYGRPILRSSGTDTNNICGAGLGYGNVTAAFKVQTGKLDFKVIPAGRTCSAAALAEKTGVDVGTDVPVTLVYAGPLDGPGTLLAMFESTTGMAQNRQTRLVNAMAGTTLTWGVATDKGLPTILARPFLNTNLGFGQLATSNMANTGFEVDKYGYLVFSPIPLAYGAAIPVPGEPKPKMLFLANLDGAGFGTLYAIGAPNSAFPVRGLYCKDSETNGMLQNCVSTEVEAFKIDVFNAGLYGAFAAVETQRALRVIQDLAARGAVSDLLCVSEVARHDEIDMPADQKAWTQEALIKASLDVPGGFQYFAQGKADLDTVPDDPVNQQGELPEPPGRAACDSSANPDSVATVYKCLMDNCSTEPGKDTGVTAGGVKCYSDTCGASALAALLFGNEAENQCFNCIVLNGISYVPWGEIKKRCATDTRRPYGWGGSASSMLLSKYKLLDVEQYVVPTTAFRRVALYTKMQYEADKSIDVYCIHAPPLLGGLMPYTGRYGNGASTSNGAAWQEENILGIQKIIDWIERKSGDRPAIIIGDWSGGAQALDRDLNVINGPDGRPIVGNVTPEGILALQSKYYEAIPDDMRQQCTAATPVCKPQCTRCPKKDLMVPGRLGNPYNTIEDPIWNLRVYVKNTWVPNPAQSAEIFYNELDRVQFTEATDFGLFGPLADTFGFRVSVRRP